MTKKCEHEKKRILFSFGKHINLFGLMTKKLLALTDYFEYGTLFWRN